MIKRLAAIKLALVVGAIALGITAVAQDRPARRGSGEPVVTFEGRQDRKIRITVDIPGRELLSVTVKGEAENGIQIGDFPDKNNSIQANKVSITIPNEGQKSIVKLLTDADKAGKTK